MVVIVPDLKDNFRVVNICYLVSQLCLGQLQKSFSENNLLIEIISLDYNPQHIITAIAIRYDSSCR